MLKGEWLTVGWGKEQPAKYWCEIKRDFLRCSVSQEEPPARLAFLPLYKLRASTTYKVFTLTPLTSIPFPTLKFKSRSDLRRFCSYLSVAINNTKLASTRLKETMEYNEMQCTLKSGRKELALINGLTKEVISTIPLDQDLVVAPSNADPVGRRVQFYYDHELRFELIAESEEQHDRVISSLYTRKFKPESPAVSEDEEIGIKPNSVLMDNAPKGRERAASMRIVTKPNQELQIADLNDREFIMPEEKKEVEVETPEQRMEKKLAAIRGTIVKQKNYQIDVEEELRETLRNSRLMEVAIGADSIPEPAYPKEDDPVLRIKSAKMLTPKAMMVFEQYTLVHRFEEEQSEAPHLELFTRIKEAMFNCKPNEVAAYATGVFLQGRRKSIATISDKLREQLFTLSDFSRLLVPFSDVTGCYEVFANMYNAGALFHFFKTLEYFMNFKKRNYSADAVIRVEGFCLAVSELQCTQAPQVFVSPLPFIKEQCLYIRMFDSVSDCMRKPLSPRVITRPILALYQFITRGYKPYKSPASLAKPFAAYFKDEKLSGKAEDILRFFCSRVLECRGKEFISTMAAVSSAFETNAPITRNTDRLRMKEALAMFSMVDLSPQRLHSAADYGKALAEQLSVI